MIAFGMKMINDLLALDRGRYRMITKEMILTAYRITGIVKRYGSEELSTLYILLNDTDEEVHYFNCENAKWGLCSADSYWDLYESEIMMTVMRSVSPEEAIEILEEKM